MKKYIKAIFIIYCAVMLWLLFGQRIGRTDFTDYFHQLKQNINLIPFETVKLFWKAAESSEGFYWLWQAVRNIGGNVVLFTPLGLLRCIFPKLENYLKFILFVTVIIAFVEIIQLFTLLGSFDIDDLILNLTGASLGYLFIGFTENTVLKKEN